MKCPIDNEPLLMSDRNGVGIDYCAEYRGPWLDRGEVDKTIERADANRRRKKESVLGKLFDC